MIKFFGLQLDGSSEKRAIEEIPESCIFSVQKAVLVSGDSAKVFCKVEEDETKDKFYLCTLKSGTKDEANIDVMFSSKYDIGVSFGIEGKAQVHLIGNIQLEEGDEDELDMMDSDEEGMEEMEEMEEKEEKETPKKDQGNKRKQPSQNDQQPKPVKKEEKKEAKQPAGQAGGQDAKKKKKKNKNKKQKVNN